MTVALRPVTRAEVTIVVDNFVDVLMRTRTASTGPEAFVQPAVGTVVSF